MFGIVPKLQRYVYSWGFWPNFMKQWIMSEKGPFTVFLYTPLAIWGVSIANIGDMLKPVEQVNTMQQFVIALTGLLFTRWTYIIEPRVMSLVICNFCMAQTGLYQLYRKQYNFIIDQQCRLAFLKQVNEYYSIQSKKYLTKNLEMLILYQQQQLLFSLIHDMFSSNQPLKRKLLIIYLNFLYGCKYPIRLEYLEEPEFQIIIDYLEIEICYLQLFLKKQKIKLEREMMFFYEYSAKSNQQYKCAILNQQNYFFFQLTLIQMSLYIVT